MSQKNTGLVVGSNEHLQSLEDRLAALAAANAQAGEIREQHDTKLESLFSYCANNESQIKDLQRALKHAQSVPDLSSEAGAAIDTAGAPAAAQVHNAS